MSKDFPLEKNCEYLNFDLKNHIVAENYLAAKNDLLLGADINHVYYGNGRSILHIAAIAYKPTIEMVKFLVENGASNLHHKDNFGKSPLYYLLIANRFDVAEFMIREFKAEIHQKDFADKPREVCTSDKSINFEEIIKWCEDLFLKLKAEQQTEAAKIAATDMSNELSDGYSVGTYLGRLPKEIIDSICNVVSNNDHKYSEFYHSDDSILGRLHNNETGAGAGANILFNTYAIVPVGGATNNYSVVYEDTLFNLSISFL